MGLLNVEQDEQYYIMLLILSRRGRGGAWGLCICVSLYLQGFSLKRCKKLVSALQPGGWGGLKWGRET